MKPEYLKEFDGFKRFRIFFLNNKYYVSSPFSLVSSESTIHTFLFFDFFLLIPG